MKQTILVAESDWFICARIRKVLEDAGYSTAGTSDKTMLLALLRMHPTPLIIVCKEDLFPSPSDPSASQFLPGLERHAFIVLTPIDGTMSVHSPLPGIYRLPAFYDDADLKECADQATLYLMCHSLAGAGVEEGLNVSSAW